MSCSPEEAKEIIEDTVRRVASILLEAHQSWSTLIIVVAVSFASLTLVIFRTDSIREELHFIGSGSRKLQRVKQE